MGRSNEAGKAGGAGASLGSAPSAARKRSISPSLLLSLIVLVALSLRLWGIGWGLPDQRHILSYHPDEGVNLVQGVLENGAPRPHLSLGFYNYGGLYFYLWQGAVAINQTYGFVRLAATGAPTNPTSDSLAAMILVGRLLTALLGALTVWAIYALGRRLYGHRAGLVAGAAYAIVPAAVIHGHYATVDVPATFLVTLALVFGARRNELRLTIAPEASARLSALRERLQTSESQLLIAGLFAGLAAAAKYNCAIVLFAPMAALAQRVRSGEKPSPWLWPGILGTAVFGFVFGCPGALLDWERFTHDVGYEIAKSREGMDLLFTGTGNGWWYHLISSMRFGMGWWMLALALAALVYACFRRERQDWYLLAFLAPYYLVIGWAQVRYLRYIIPMLPALAVLIGGYIATERPKRTRTLIWAIGAIAFAATAVISLALDRVMILPDARDQACDYIERNVPRGSSIAFAKTPWYFTPPLTPGFTLMGAPQRREAGLAETRWTLRMPVQEWDTSVLSPIPDYVVMSDIESEDAVRLDYAPARTFLDLLNKGYVARSFENVPTIWGIALGKPGYVPNDWLYIYPRITVYQRRR